MKKVLLATTALVFTAGYAAAEVTVSGEGKFGLKYLGADEDNFISGTNENPEETELFLELDFGIAGSTTTDGGIEVGASFDIDFDVVGDQGDVGDAGSEVDDGEIFISAGGVTLTVGQVGSADGVVIGGLQDPGFDGIGIDDTATVFWDDGTANVQVKAELGAITLAASGNLAENETEADDDYSIGAGYDAGTFSVGAAFSELNGEEVFAIGATVTAGGADVDLFYHANDDADIAGYGASVTYPVGALELVGTIGATDLDDDEVDFGFGAEYDLGGGVSVAGGIGSVDNPFLDDDSVASADFGIKMKF